MHRHQRLEAVMGQDRKTALFCLIFGAVLSLVCCADTGLADESAELQFLETRIRPVLSLLVLRVSLSLGEGTERRTPAGLAGRDSKGQ